MAGVLVTLFRFAIDFSQYWLLPDGQTGNYEALPGWLRFLLPVAGALVVGLIFERLPAGQRAVGIVHVLNYLRFRKQRLPLTNAVVQFFGGWLAIVSGHSVDREGPGVHLGAATTSLLTARIKLNEDDSYLLAAAGGAAAIAAAFNTPLAGVIFVIEVLRVRYTITNILPVIVASVVGAIIGRLVYGPSPAFDVPAVSIGSLIELPMILVMGVLIGLLAAGFILAVQYIATQTINWRPLPAYVLAGLVTGVLAQWAPEIMGLSYDALNRIFHNGMDLQTLLLLVVAKLVATAFAIGLRVPGGLIGPSLVVGGSVGGIIALLLFEWSTDYTGTAGFYAMIGMVAMMGAVLRAPLAALVALVELTGNLNIILPGMLAVVAAEIAARSLVGETSAFTAILKVQHAREATQDHPEVPQPAMDDGNDTKSGR
ncbi:MAG: chloride channel protein [Gammaproteobacteria bacterium]|nr:chloride channel protein [Gammaproteobacteria bacterium]NNJ96570.1 chloride channel protein [Gammaproteobacteria bacterium]